MKEKERRVEGREEEEEKKASSGSLSEMGSLHKTGQHTSR